VPAIGGSVEEAAGDLRAAKAIGAHQIVEGIVDFGMERVRQFVGEPAVRRLVDEGLNSGHQGAIAGKPDGIVGPQAGVVEAGRFAEGIVTAAMGITGQLIQELEFAKHSEVGTRAEGHFQFGQSGNFIAQEMLTDGLRVEGEWPHNDIVPTKTPIQSKLYHKSWTKVMAAEECHYTHIYGTARAISWLEAVFAQAAVND
jgi:hypothetical protein